MATTVNLEAHGHNRFTGQTSVVTGTASLNDVVVNVSPNDSGGWNTATVTADKQTSIYMSASAAIAAGVPPGWYLKSGATTFRKGV